MSTTKTKWAPCLLVQWHPMLGGISTTCTKRLPGAFDTQREAMEAAEKLARQHPEAIGYSAKRVLVRRKAGNSGCMLTKVDITSAPQNLSKLDIRASDNSTVNGQVSKLVSSKSPIPTEQALPMPADDFDRIEAERAKVFSWSEHIDNARSGEQ